MIIKPVESNNKTGSYYDITIIIDKSGFAQMIDNSVEDWTAFCDCSTAIVKKVKILKP